MDRIWQWAWDRYRSRYSWAIWAISLPILLPVYLALSFIVVAFEKSNHYIEAAAVTVVGVLVLQYLIFLPRLGPSRPVEQWAEGQEVDRARTLGATYTWARGLVVRAVVGGAVWAVVQLVVVGVIAGATESRLVQYAILAAAFGTATQLSGVHSFVEGALRPTRVAIAGDTGIGDALPRSRPTFAAWTNVSMLAVAFSFAATGAMLATLFDRAGEDPVVSILIASALTLIFGPAIFAA